MVYRTRRDEPIIQSLLDLDFYKLTMGQLIFLKHKDVLVKFAFKNRSGIPLAQFIDKGRIREELEHVRSLRFQPQELHYVYGTYEYGQKMFDESYIRFLMQLRLPAYEFSTREGELKLEFGGKWSENTYWETIALSIINQLYYEHIMKDYSRFERDLVWATGQERLAEKIEKIKGADPQLVFSDFGTRRRFSREWHDYIVGVLAEQFPLQNDGSRNHQFLGTSNVYLAMKYGLEATGTNAHEMPMAYSGIYYDEDEKAGELVSQKKFLEDWWELYGQGLSIFLPDTAGSDYFFKHIVTEEQLREWKGSRQDSGKPSKYIKKRIEQYRKYGINPRKKLLICADGQNVDTAIDLVDRFYREIILSFGFGTNLTNDVGFEPISIVIKVIEAAGHQVAKLSDNIMKATGSKSAIKRLKKLTNYNVKYSERCRS